MLAVSTTLARSERSEKPLAMLKRLSSFDILYARGAVPKWEGRGLQNLHSWVRFPPAPPTHLIIVHLFGATGFVFHRLRLQGPVKGAADG